MSDIIHVSQRIREYVEENYILNRDKIISELYVYFADDKANDIVKLDGGEYVSEDDRKKMVQIFEQLQKIQNMVELNFDADEILSELEIIEVSASFLQKHMKIESDKRSRRVRC